MNRIIIAILAFAFSAAQAFAAAPIVFDFANLKYIDPPGPLPLGNYGFLPTDGVFCTGGDLCSSNVNGGVRNDDLTFVSGGLTVKATGYYNGNLQAVVQDHENSYNGLLYGSTASGAGLGVYHKTGDTSDDNVTAGEMLKLSFSQTVLMPEFGMRAEGHNTTSWLTNASFEYSTNGVNWVSALLPDNNVVGNANAGRFVLGLVSKDFYFRYGGTMPIDQFYISSITVSVPEPETYALMLAGLGLLGFAARRRRLSAIH